MKNILTEKDYLEISYRIQNLNESSTKQWGKMNIHEMLVHCTRQLKLALGEIENKQQGLFIFRTKIGKWITLSPFPWPKGFSTPIEMNSKKNNFTAIQFELTKSNLLNDLDLVKNRKNLQPHPFFGNLNKQDWSRLIYKHLDHHLKQFSN